jgi:hypothetical protein
MTVPAKFSTYNVVAFVSCAISPGQSSSETERRLTETRAAAPAASWNHAITLQGLETRNMMRLPNNQLAPEAQRLREGPAKYFGSSQ